MDELKPCPFCGGEARSVFHASRDVAFVECCSCGAMVGRNYRTISSLRGKRHYDTREEAIEAWNRRAGDTKSYRVPSKEEWRERYATKKRLAGYKKEDTNG